MPLALTPRGAQWTTVSRGSNAMVAWSAGPVSAMQSVLYHAHGAEHRLYIDAPSKIGAGAESGRRIGNDRFPDFAILHQAEAKHTFPAQPAGSVARRARKEATHDETRSMAGGVIGPEICWRPAPRRAPAEGADAGPPRPGAPHLRHHVIQAPQACDATKSDGCGILEAMVEQAGDHRDLTAGGIYSLLKGAWETVPGSWDLPSDEMWCGVRPGSRGHAEPGRCRAGSGWGKTWTC